MALGGHARGPSGYAIPTVGTTPENYASNGRSASAHAALKLASTLNTLSVKRKRTLYTRIMHPSQVSGFSSTKTVLLGAFRTGPDCQFVRAVIVCAPADTTSTAQLPAFRFHLTPEGDAEFDQPTIYVAHRKTSSAVLDDAHVVEQVWGLDDTNPIESSTFYRFRVSTDGQARLISLTILEEPLPATRIDLDDATAFAAADHTEIVPGGPITTGSLDRMFSSTYKLWKEGGSEIFTDSFEVTPGSPTEYETNSATHVHVLDTSLGSSFDANGPGFWSVPYKKGTYDSRDVPVQFRVLARDTFSGGEVKLINSTRTICTVPITSSTGSWYTVSGTLSSSLTSDMLQVTFRSGTGTCSVQTMHLTEFSSS